MNEQIWDAITKRWNLKILRSLDIKTAIRFNALKQLIPRISSNLLSDRLHELEKLGLVKRIISNKSPFQIGYVLDEKCIDLKKILIDLEDWIISYQISNKKRISRFTNSFLIDHMLQLLKKEVKHAEFEFIKDKLSLPPQEHSSHLVDHFTKLQNIILELYGEDLGNKILQKLNQQLNGIN